MSEEKEKDSFMEEKVFIYDTTLRDGAQGQGSSWTLEDKLKIVFLLDDFGVDYIEGGWPGSNPKDEEFFSMMMKEKLKHSRLAAFGSTRKSGVKVDKDQQIRKLLSAQTETVTVYGKTWTLHVHNVLKTSLEENIEMIYDTVKFLKMEGREVIFDAEHFFDGVREDKNYAFRCIQTAIEAGADWIVLCDTNGGSLPWFIKDTVKELVEKYPEVKLGIHAHNDLDLAVANSIEAVIAGARQVQGTMNGLGERCGNANLTSIIPILKFKANFSLSCDVKKLKHVSDIIWELSNIAPPKNQPFVGEAAFAHKGGVHIDAMVKDMSSYEHMAPELVGNRRRILISDLAGKTAIKLKLEELGLPTDDATARKILTKVKQLEKEGYDFEMADASLTILILNELGRKPKFFDFDGFAVFIYREGNMGGKEKIDMREEKIYKREKKEGIYEVEKDVEEFTRTSSDLHYRPAVYCQATVRIIVGNEMEHTASDGNGPVNALDRALRKALEKFFPEIKEIELSDFKVRVVSGSQGTGARVRVYVESTDGKRRWGTVGVSENIIQASWKALLESIEYKIIMDRTDILKRLDQQNPK